jgi:hypothetical protein
VKKVGGCFGGWHGLFHRQHFGDRSTVHPDNHFTRGRFSVPDPQRTATSKKHPNRKIVNLSSSRRIKANHPPMTCDVEIPREPLDIQYCNSGRLPHVALHQRKGLFFHECSYSAWQGWSFLITRNGSGSPNPKVGATSTMGGAIPGF